MARKYAVQIDGQRYIGEGGWPVAHLVQAALMDSKGASHAMSDQARYGARCQFIPVDVDESGDVPVMQVAREGT